MKDRTKDGGQAFPAPWAVTGMTLRDYFAAQAMPAMAPSLSPEEIADKSYEVADAMLKARRR